MLWVFSWRTSGRNKRGAGGGRGSAEGREALGEGGGGTKECRHWTHAAAAAAAALGLLTPGVMRCSPSLTEERSVLVYKKVFYRNTMPQPDS